MPKYNPTTPEDIMARLPHIERWAAEAIAAEMNRRTGPNDPDPAGELAYRAETEYSHSDEAHNDAN